MSFLTELTDEAKKKLALLIAQIQNRPETPVSSAPQPVQQSQMPQSQGAQNFLNAARVQPTPSMNNIQVQNQPQRSPSFMERLAGGLSGLNQKYVQPVAQPIVNDIRRIPAVQNLSRAVNQPAPQWMQNVNQGLSNFSGAMENAPKLNFADNIQNPVLRTLAGIPQGIANTPSDFISGGLGGYGQDISPFTGQGRANLLNKTGQAINVGLNVGGLLGGGEAAGSLAKEGFRDIGKETLGNLAKEGAITGLKQGAAYGAGSGVASALQTPGSAMDKLSAIPMSTIKNAAVGAVLGTTLGASIPVVSNEVKNQLMDIKNLIKPEYQDVVYQNIRTQNPLSPSETLAKPMVLDETMVREKVPFNPKSGLFKTLKEGGVGLSTKDVSGGKASQPLQEGGANASSSIPNTELQPQGQPVPEKSVLPTNPVPEQTAQVPIDNKLPEQNVSYNQDITPNADNVKSRGFLDTINNSETTTSQVNKAVESLPNERTPIENKATLDAAQTRIDSGKYTAYKYVTDNSPLTAEKTATGQILVNKFADEGDLDRAREVANSLTSQGTKAGQGIQMFSNWDKLSPANLLKLANKSAEDLHQELPQEFQNSVIARANDIQKMAEGADKLQATQGLLSDIAQKLPQTSGEWLTNYRYQNMLSGPTPIEKIEYSGAFNALVTHPLDMFSQATVDVAKKVGSTILGNPYKREVYYSDIPTYAKNVVMGIPDAWKGLVGAFKGDIGTTFTDNTKGFSVINKLRQENTTLIPGTRKLAQKVGSVLGNEEAGKSVGNFLQKPFTTIHSAIYQFNSALISAGEKAVQMSHGVNEVEATKIAQELGDKLTLRSPLGQGEMSRATKAVDMVGQMVSKLNNSDSVGWATKWVAPFMKVSTNLAKLQVEHSPLSLLDNPKNYTSSTVAKALVGSAVTGVGTVLAMNGQTTWAVPTDPKQRDLFYASGRKPYSFSLDGKTWIPMIYAGPLALSLALPTAIRDATQEVNAPADAFTKISKIAQNNAMFIASNTPLPAIAGFMNMLAGDTSISLAKMASDMGSQAMPLDALQRYIAGVVDPIYRKTATQGLPAVKQRLESGIPWLSRNLPAYTTPTGQPETRNLSNYIAPYPIGKQDNQYEPAFQQRQKELNSNAVINQANKAVANGETPNISGKQVSDKVWTQQDGTFTYQLTDGSFAKAKTVDQAKLAQAKDTLTNTDGQQYAVSGNKVLVKNDDGTIRTITTKTPVDPTDTQSLAMIASGHTALTQDPPTGDSPADNQLKRQQTSELQSLYLDENVSDDQKQAAYQKMGLDANAMDKLMQMKDDGIPLTTTTLEAYQFDQQAKQLPKDQANEMVKQLFYNDPKAYKLVKQIHEYDMMGISTSNITGYKIANGERAAYLNNILSKRNPDEANAILADLFKQGLVSKTVLKQLRQLKNGQ